MKKNKMSYVCGTLCCLLAFSSCLGDTATQLTMANQTGVVTTELPSAGKAVYVKGGRSDLVRRLSDGERGRGAMYPF